MRLVEEQFQLRDELWEGQDLPVVDAEKSAASGFCSPRARTAPKGHERPVDAAGGVRDPAADLDEALRDRRDVAVRAASPGPLLRLLSPDARRRLAPRPPGSATPGMQITWLHAGHIGTIFPWVAAVTLADLGLLFPLQSFFR